MAGVMVDHGLHNPYNPPNFRYHPYNMFMNKMTDVLSHNGYLLNADVSNKLRAAATLQQRLNVEELLNGIRFDTKETVVSPLPAPSLPQLPLFVEQVKRPSGFLHPTGETKKIYYCQRCLNHGRAEPRKNHKCECPFANCACQYCILVEKRRQLNSQLQQHNIEGPAGESTELKEDEEKHSHRPKGERVPNCQKCGQHGKKSRLKGHKRVCPFRDCECPKCQVVTERQKLMADQIKIRRRQKKDTIMNMTREHITSTLNAAAALSAAGLPQFPFNNINAALLYQMKTLPSSLLTSPASSDGSSYSPQSQIGSAFTAPTASPEILKAPLVSPSPPSPVQAGIVAPVAINPSTPTAFNFPTLIPSETLLQSLLANYKLLEQKLDSDSIDCSNPIIDVCSV